MIFVTTGIHEHGFDRLVKAVDDLAGQEIVKDVFIQTGFSAYQPKNCEWSKSIDFMDFEKRMDKSDVVITHGGAGCIAGALECNKPTIVVPRLRKYNEHNNDHQLELASTLEKSGRVLVVRDVKDLAETIKKVWNFKPRLAVGENRISKIVRDFLVQIAKEKGLEI